MKRRGRGAKLVFAIPFDSDLIWDRCTRRFIMVKPISDDSAFAKHFIESALKCLKSGEYAWALQSLGNAADAIKMLKKQADGAG
jgi:hypothetical protein